MNYCDFLFNVPEKGKDSLALVDVDSETEFTYEELQRSVISLSNSFRKRGMQSGDVVLLHMVNSAEVVISHLAVQYLGGISCLLDPLVPVNSLEYYVKDSNAKHILSHLREDRLNVLDVKFGTIINSTEILDMISLADTEKIYKPFNFSEKQLSVIFYTSGTTNQPKGVMLAPKNYFNHVEIFREGCYDYSESDKLLCFVPFSHGYGSKSVFLPSLNAGSCMYIMRSFHPYKVIEAIEKYNITYLFGVPSHFQQLLKKDEFIPALKKLKGAFTAAALLKTETAEDWHKKVGSYLDEGYGLIETSTGVAFRTGRLPEKIGDIGTYPNSLVEISVVDENFNELPTGERGEIVIKSESVMLGYLNKIEETNSALVNDWFRTGDMGYKTKESNIILTGRIKDVINIAGIKVSPFEIEAEINSHNLIMESAVFGIEDEMYGEVVVAFAKPISINSISERELIKYLQKKLMNFQVPKKIIFKNELPRNNMGKIDKKSLKYELLNTEV